MPLPDADGVASGNTMALQGNDPFASGADPFGTSPAGAADPFAVSGDDPFVGGGQSNPFGADDEPQNDGGVDFDALLSGGDASQPASTSEDPFGGGGANPFGPAGDGPAGSTGVSASPSNPFGADASEPLDSSKDPFGGDADPFGGGADPFAGGDDPFSGASDPFSGASDPFSGANDPFASSDDPFAASPADSSSGADEAADGLFQGEEEEDSLFLASANTSGAMFDEDDSEHDSYGAVAAPAPAADKSSRKEAPASRQAPPKKKGGSALAPLLVVALGVVGADYMGYLDLGIGKALKEALGVQLDEDQQRQAKTKSASLVKAVTLDDTLSTYKLEIDRLERISKLSPQDMLVRQQLMDRLLDSFERFPELFDKEPRYRKRLEALQAKLPLPKRYAVLMALAESKFEGLEEAAVKLTEADGATADDYGVAVVATFDLYRSQRIRHHLANPGESSDPSSDPMARPSPDAPLLKRARGWLDKALALSSGAPNHLKFQYYNARLNTLLGAHEKVIKGATALLQQSPEHARARLLLAGAYVDGNLLGKAAELLRIASERAVENGEKSNLVRAYRIEARLEGKRGRHEDQLTALQGVLKMRPADELTTVRTGRLLLQQKHAQECQALLVDGKKRGMKSIAFEVALVDFWLWSNRTEDALEEIKVATKLYPETVELLYLRGQIEDRQQHFATARDYFAKVIERQPKHLRAITRLAQLQSAAGRHDQSLQTLVDATKRLGELEVLLEPMADELYVLKRTKEAREVYGKLLKRQPSNKKYLINAARIDMDNGAVDRALRYMRMLRDDGNLDMKGALQMAEALVLKGEHAEASKTIVPFAELEPNNVELNTLAGKALLDSGQLDLAKTFLERAHSVAQRQGGNSETLFHFGRLAFKQERVKQGIARLQLAIKSQPDLPYYRYYLGGELMRRAAISIPHSDEPKLRARYKQEEQRRKELGVIAVREMKWLVLHASRFAAIGKPLAYLDDVQRQIGLHFIREKRFEDSIAHLRQSVNLNDTHVQTLGALGMALFKTNDSSAKKVLRRVIQLKPSDPFAALYLGLIAQQDGNSTDALMWLKRAAKSSSKDVVEAHFQVALIYRERRQKVKARRAIKRFLRLAPAGHPFREEAASMLEDLGGG